LYLPRVVYVITVTAAHVLFPYYASALRRDLHSFPTRRSSDLKRRRKTCPTTAKGRCAMKSNRSARMNAMHFRVLTARYFRQIFRSEEHTSELQSRFDLVCRLLLEKRKTTV